MALVTRRNLVLGAATAGAAGLGVVGDAFAIEPGFLLESRHYRVTPPGWPDKLRLRIGVIADIHAADPWISLPRVRAIVDATMAMAPDVIVILGDFVCTHRWVTAYVRPEDWADELAKLGAPFGVYAILGNHDWWSAAIPTDPPDNSASVRRAIARARIRLLENDALRLSKDGSPFWLLGLGDQLAHWKRGRGFVGVDDLPKTLREVHDDAPAILLAHEPRIFEAVPDRVALTLAGHTHGGQVNLPFVTQWLIEGPRDLDFIYGHYRRGSRDLIVSGGLGTSHLPVRFLRPPEVLAVDVGA
ncbi:MAG: metallophosphoesterase [Hyphomicrobiales bacterium]|nr:metallophosphoesterase [Hyphomicrobiales bacterium]MDE2017559.1 metallophosphoesterase [Hyphomicrobiales bacterium]